MEAQKREQFFKGMMTKGTSKRRIPLLLGTFAGAAVYLYTQRMMRHALAASRALAGTTVQ
jgi:hypothetical protein